MLAPLGQQSGVVLGNHNYESRFNGERKWMPFFLPSIYHFNPFKKQNSSREEAYLVLLCKHHAI